MSRLKDFVALLASLAYLAGLGCACLPAVAQASQTAQLKVWFSPYKLGGTTTIEAEVKLANTNGGLPSPVTNFDTRLPPKLELIASTLGLAICEPAALVATGLEGCSANARVGTGSAQVDVPFGPEIVNEAANVTAFLGPPLGENVEVLLFTEGQTPVFAQSVFPGVLLLGSGQLGESLNTEVPVTPTLPGAPDASVTSMHLSLGPAHLTYFKQVHGRTVRYRPRGISLPSTCPSGGFLFLTALTFQDGTNLTVSSTVPCPPARRHSRRH